MSIPHPPTKRARYSCALWVSIGATIASWGISRAVVAQGPLSGSERPNIIMILSDDAGYNDFGFMSALNGISTDVQTPNLDLLAQRSMVMSSGYVTDAVCSPSRAGFLTGQYQQRFGYEDNIGATDGFEAGQLLISHQLKNLGYTTGALGKWHMGQVENVNRPLDVGFDEFFGFYAGGRPFWGSPGTDSGRMIRRGNDGIETQWVNEGDTSRYDPVKGRYLTDALGEEAADFIDRHANDENPFFLYVSLNAPHTPLQAKQSDLDQLAHIADPSRRLIAAMTYGLDRAVGDITSALDANGIDDNTVIVFMNDNGGTSESPHSNAPLRGNKGSLWEGGIRVPFMVKAPDLMAGVYAAPVSSVDLMSTFVSLAGGDVDQLDTDGVDLMPFLSGDIAEDPHELMFWRSAGGRFAVRRGDWKLVRPGSATFARLHNVVDDVNEANFVNAQHPEIVAELLRELTFWEATLQKPKWGALGASRNRFDHFVFRNDLAATQNWSTGGTWRREGTGTNVTLIGEDAYANAILEFTTRTDADYTAVNNMKRATNQIFMLNQIRFTGDFTGTNNYTGALNGNELLFTNSLDGEAPQIQLTAASSNTDAVFTFRLDNQLQLLDDLEISGNGTQAFIIHGSIIDYFAPRGVTKTGASSVTLAGNNTFGGTLTVNDGKVKLDGPAAAIDGAAGIVVGASGEFELASGLVAVETIDNSTGGTFNFHGGTLKATSMLGDLANNGGTFAPGASPALSTISGDFTQSAGALEIEIGGTTVGDHYDKLAIDGAAALGGSLEVKLINSFAPAFGQVFQILSAADGITGAFDDLMLPALGGNLHWSTRMTGNALSLIVGLPGDYNIDGSVDAADYTIWRDTYGQTVAIGTGADGNRDGEINDADFNLWKSNFGALAVNNSGSGAAAAPEPGTWLLLAIGASLVAIARRSRRPLAKLC